MKRSILFVLLLSLVSVVLAQEVSLNVRKGWEKNLPNLSGDIASVTISEYIAKEGVDRPVKGELIRRVCYKFDAQGDVVERVVLVDAGPNGLNTNDTPLSRKANRYDAEGNVVEEVIYSGDISKLETEPTTAVRENAIEVEHNTAIASVEESLQGRIAGVEVLATDDGFTSTSSIRVRGARSIVAADTPLIVVDGVVDAVSSVSDIESSDIKSMTILKDASSTAEYGPRGANGVILITTHGAAATTSKELGNLPVPKAIVRYKIIYRR